MDRKTITGLALSLIGFLGYVAGVYIPYPGRAFSLTVLMIGIARIAIAQATGVQT